AGVPPTNTVTPLGGVIDRSSAIFLAASLRLTKPFSITRTELSFGWVVLLGPATHGLPAMSGQGRSSHVLLVKPVSVETLLRMSATCWSVTGLWLLLWITSVNCSVR